MRQGELFKSLDERIRDAHTNLGGRAEPEKVAHAVINSIPAAERASMLFDHVLVRVSRALRAKTDDELAFAQAIDGTYVQLSFMDESEYRFVVQQHAKLSRSHRRIAVRYVEHCQQHLGVDISDELQAASA